MIRSAYALLLILGLLATPCRAVIVAGASGGGNTNNNTTAAQFQSEFGFQAEVINNIFQFGGGSAVYLGYDQSTREVWALTARHINPNGVTALTATIDGLDYQQQSYTVVGGDVAVVKYKRADNQVPGLNPISLSTTVPAASTALLMVGKGRNRIEDATTNREVPDSVSTTVGTGYNWTTSDNRIVRWGTNNVEAEFLDALESGGPATGVLGTFSMGAYTTVGFMTDFDEPAGAGGNPNDGEWLSSNEAQGSAGDSGGGVFTFVNGQWVLSGIFSTVYPFVGQDAETAAFGNITGITDISTYKSGIDSAIGVTLIPETSSWILAVGSTLLLVRRRR